MLSADDKLEILDVLARYNRAADDRDVAAYADLFTPEGVIEGDMKTRPGQAGLREDLPALFEMEGTLKRHLSLNHVIEGSDDHVVVRSLLLVCEGETMPAVEATSQITDNLERLDGRWLVARHHVKIDPAMFHLLEEQQGEADRS